MLYDELKKQNDPIDINNLRINYTIIRKLDMNVVYIHIVLLCAINF